MKYRIKYKAQDHKHSYSFDGIKMLPEELLNYLDLNYYEHYQTEKFVGKKMIVRFETTNFPYRIGFVIVPSGVYAYKYNVKADMYMKFTDEELMIFDNNDIKLTATHIIETKQDTLDWV